MVELGMKDEVFPINFRPARIHGALHFSRTGIISFVGGSIPPNFAATTNQNLMEGDYQTEKGDGFNSY